MPELPEVETITRVLQAHVCGAIIEDVRITRPTATKPQDPAFVREGIAGRRILDVTRRAKNILLHLDGNLVARVHLRMTGHLYPVADRRDEPKTTRLSFDLTDGRAIVLDDPRTLGRVTLHDEAELPTLLAGYGPEPLSAEFTPELFVETAGRSRQPTKIWLLNQEHVSGLGNIWAAEALFRARINPQKPIGALRRPRLLRLHEAIVTVLTDAVQSALALVRQPSDFPEAEFLNLQVYGREGQPCFVCGRKIKRLAQGGRSTYYCAFCQKT